MISQIYQEVSDAPALASPFKRLSSPDKKKEQIILNGWDCFKKVLLLEDQNLINQKMEEFLNAFVKGTCDQGFEIINQVEKEAKKELKRSCHICDKFFTRPSSLQKHLQSAHNITNVVEEERIEEENNELPISSTVLTYKGIKKSKEIYCPHCGQLQVTKLTMQNHLQIVHKKEIEEEMRRMFIEHNYSKKVEKIHETEEQRERAPNPTSTSPSSPSPSSPSPSSPSPPSPSNSSRNSPSSLPPSSPTSSLYYTPPTSPAPSVGSSPPSSPYDIYTTPVSSPIIQCDEISSSKN
ncbi:early growth response protein 1-like [Leptopilina heterotoma]|uniref:early growth response protein 1-like n=1 Tax=Leptopilina heterotoma TaxID=63436 RepID=UPI001CA8A9A8|nr:early growth response protein 1-like [Leptopilina heterotoma]